MKGAGSYNNDWPYYASPSSNLSAFAAPFSVNRSSNDVVSAPFMDSSESADSSVVPSIQPLHSGGYGYDFFSDPVKELDSKASSKPYGYSGFLEPLSSQLPSRFNSLVSSMDNFSYDQNPNSSKPSVDETHPYYPSYVPSPIHDPAPCVAPTIHWPSSSGFATVEGSSAGDYANKSPELVRFTGQRVSLWNQFGELNHGKSMQVGVGSSFPTNQTKFSGSAVEERMEQGRQDVQDSTNGEVSHMIGWEKHNVPRSADHFDDKSLWWGSIKPLPTDFPSTSVIASSSASLESHGKDPFKVPDPGNRHLSYISSYDKYLRQQDESSRVDTASPTPVTTDLNIGNIVTDGIYNFKEAYHMPNPGTAGYFDTSHLPVHPGRNDPSSSKIATSSNKNVSSDVLDYIFKELHGSQDSHANLGNLSLRLSSNGNSNSVEKSIDGADRCNPAVDSPCWKGSPVGHFSHYQVSKALPPEYLHKNEKCFDSAVQDPLSFILDTALVGSTTKFSVAKFASENCNVDGAVNTGPLQSEPTCDSGIKCLNDSGLKCLNYNNVPSTKSYDCETGSSHSEHHVGVNKLMMQKLHTSLADGTRAGTNVNNGLECDKSHMAEHSLSSTSSVEDGPTTLEESAEKVSHPIFDVRILVDRMQNLSEMLLMQLSNDACELKEQDCNALKNVISNLNTCVSKNAEQITPSQEPQPATCRSAGQSCKLQQNTSFEKQHVCEVEAESSKVEHENPLVQDAKDMPFNFEVLVSKLSDSISPSGDAEMKKEDNMTEALKRILSENFHDDEEAESQGVLYKNLWLEAEAALCSINYKARYNKMKIEMEKYKQKGMGEHSSLSKSQSSGTKVLTDPDPYVSSLLDSAVLNSPILKCLSDSNISFDINQPNAFTPEGKSSQYLDSFIQNSTVSESDTKKEAGDDEASVMARFHVLKARGDKSCINTVNMEEPSETVANSPPREREDQNQVNICHDSPTPCRDENNAIDYEASVMARFHILKSRVEDSCSLCSDSRFLDVLADKGAEEAIVTTKESEGHSFDVNVNPSEMHFCSHCALDKSIPKELHVDLEDHEGIEPCWTNQFENQLATCYSDGLSLDWEHVEKRSL